MNVSSIGKCLDQPLLTNALARKMPVILTGTALTFGIKDTLKQPKEKRKKQAIKNTFILGSIVAASLLGSKIKIGGQKLIETIPKEKIVNAQTNVIENYITKNNPKDTKLLNIFQKAKSKFINPKDTDYVLATIKNTQDADKLTEVLFSKKDDLNSGEIFSEILRLSTMGFIPVASGIAGGVAADIVNKESNGEKTKNKIKEGIYQFFANICLCNIGAGAALFTAEKLQEKHIIKKLTPLKKTGVILGGILTVGVIGGSYIANMMGDKIINPLLDRKNHKKTDELKSLYKSLPFTLPGHDISQIKKHKHKHKEERKPEPLDLALHTDDVATAGVLSGVKWIEPLLPVMYLVSGYRAGIGYRNNK